VVGYLFCGRSPDNPSATRGETDKAGPLPAVADARIVPRISLDLGFLVHAQHDGLLRGVEVQARDVDEFLLEALIVREL
jgi:hypothetical protein